MTVVLTMRARWTARLLRPRWRSGQLAILNLIEDLADMVRGAQQLAPDVPLWLSVEMLAPVTPQRRQAVLLVRVYYEEGAAVA